MAGLPERCVIVRSRMADGYHLTELGLKQVQHVLTDWFPRAVFGDLTEDTVRVDVLVKPGRTTGKNVYHASFLRADGSGIKTLEYDEDRLSGKVCNAYDTTRSGYFGKKEGHDYRVLRYTNMPTTFYRR